MWHVEFSYGRTPVWRQPRGSFATPSASGGASRPAACPASSPGAARASTSTRPGTSATRAALLPDDRATRAPPTPVDALTDEEVGALGALMAAALIPRERRLACPRCGAVADVAVADARRASPARDAATRAARPAASPGTATASSSAPARRGRTGPGTRRRRLVRLTSRGCPGCGARTTHFHGHACHHISPSTGGCPACGAAWCYACGATGDDNLRLRGKRSACLCARGTWSAGCENRDVATHVDARSGYPADRRCGCPICPTCRVGAPCELCDGTCCVCEGLVPPGPLEVPDDVPERPSWLSLLWYGAAPPEAPGDWRDVVDGMLGDEPEEAAAAPRRPRGPPRRVAMMLACKRGRADVVEFLLARGVSPDGGARHDGAPRGGGARHADVARVLVAHGADVDRRDDGGCTALVLAARKGRAAVVALLVASGADPNLRDAHGFQALHCAAWKGHADAAAALVAAEGVERASKLPPGSLFEGHTPLSLARLHGHKRVAVILALAKTRAFGAVGTRTRAAVLRSAAPPESPRDRPGVARAARGPGRRAAALLSFRRQSSV
ncbi:hypothetical protein JL720_3019 [Aureococcus anophagefferens]|nr:hypothetical protein JL720_3019 [Aureococcus anophagefferens]